MKAGTENGFGLDSGPSADLANSYKIKTGTVLVPDLARKVSQRHWRGQPAQPAAPTGQTGPAQRKFYCINAKTVHVFFILAGGQPVPCLTPRNSPGWRAKPFTFFLF